METNNKETKPFDKLEKGKHYKCIQTVEMDDGEIAYIEGKTYLCEMKGCITDESGDKEHYWVFDSNNEQDDDVREYFIPVEENEETDEWVPESGDLCRWKDAKEGEPNFYIYQDEVNPLTFRTVDDRESGISGGETSLWRLKEDAKLIRKNVSVEEIQEEIKKSFEEAISKSNENLQKKIGSRQEYNLKCLEVLKEVVLKYPDWRFMQILYNMELCEDRFYEESVDTFEKLPKI